MEPDLQEAFDELNEALREWNKAIGKVMAPLTESYGRILKASEGIKDVCEDVETIEKKGQTVYAGEVSGPRIKRR